MDAKDAIELVLLLLIVATALAYLARRLGLPYPILLVLGGVVLGLVLTAIPDAPTVQLPPDIVFLLFLPPILFGSGYFTQIRDFKANARPIALLAIGLVLFTTVVVGLVVGTGSSPRSSGRRRSRSARSSPRRTPSRRPRSCAGSACRAGS